MANLPASDYDTPWKEAIDLYFQDFMQFFFPQFDDDIDWKRGYENRDIEIQEIVRDAQTGRRYADKLMQVWLENGQETWILIHIEVQSQRDAGFAERMYVYNHRFFDRYRHQVISLAVLGDNSPSWRPSSYGYSLHRFESWLRFPIVKLLDYGQNWEALENNDNPFAVVVMGHLMAMSSSNNPEGRYNSKLRIVRLLFQRGYNRQQAYELMRFVNWMMTLPRELAEDFQTEKQQIEEEYRMPYITTWERNARLDNAREFLRDVLEAKFGTIVPELASRLGQLSRQLEPLQELIVLKELHKSLVSMGSIEEFLNLFSDDPTDLIPEEPVRIEPVRPDWLDNPEIVRQWWGGDTPPAPTPEQRERTRREILEMGAWANQVFDALETARTSVIKVLEARFGQEISFEMTEGIYAFSDLEVLNGLLIAAAKVGSLEEFDEVLSRTAEN